MSTPLWLFSKGRVSHLFITLHVNCKVASSIATGQLAGLSDSPEAPGDLCLGPVKWLVKNGEKYVFKKFGKNASGNHCVGEHVNERCSAICLWWELLS